MKRRAAILAIVLAFLSPASALAGDLLDKPPLPDQFFGVQIMLPAGVLIGNHMDKVAQPQVGFGFAFQVRAANHWYVDFNYEQRFPLQTTAPKGGFLLGVDATSLGARGRIPIGSKQRSLVVGGGIGGVRLHPIEPTNDTTTPVGPSSSGAGLYGILGLEHEVFGSGSSAGYVGVETRYNHFFTDKKVGFSGGLFDARVAFSYYFGGDDARECW